MVSKFSIREVSAHDPLSEITELLHCAYAKNLAAGLRFNAAWQPESRTRERFEDGFGLVAHCGIHVAGTIAVCLPERLPYGTYHPDGLVASFGQFAVSPEFQGCGLGAMLVEEVRGRCREHGAKYLALDTAKPADGLIRFYQSMGFEIVGEVDYRPGTNYPSWVLAQEL